jgi:DNA-binding GntR family transcriptional regulator
LARTAIDRAAGLKIMELEGRHIEVAAALHEVTDRMAKAVVAGERGAALSDLDIEFHELLVQMAHSIRLSRMIADAIGAANAPVFHKLLAEHMDDAVASGGRA